MCQMRANRDKILETSSSSNHLTPRRHFLSVPSLCLRRPGILVLINDADWELEGELDYELQDGDEVCFISTLHGG